MGTGGGEGEGEVGSSLPPCTPKQPNKTAAETISTATTVEDVDITLPAQEIYIQTPREHTPLP